MEEAQRALCELTRREEEEERQALAAAAREAEVAAEAEAEVEVAEEGEERRCEERRRWEAAAEERISRTVEATIAAQVQ